MGRYPIFTDLLDCTDHDKEILKPEEVLRDQKKVFEQYYIGKDLELLWNFWIKLENWDEEDNFISPEMKVAKLIEYMVEIGLLVDEDNILKKDNS